MAKEYEWTEVRRRRRWDNRKEYRSSGGVTTMFVSNLPDGAKKEVVKRIFQKHGTVVDIYMAGKKDSNRKNFAFVRFNGVDCEEKLEKSLQGLRYSRNPLVINIARFERKQTGGIQTSVLHPRRPHKTQSNKPLGGARDKRSFAEVAAGGAQSAAPPPTPPPPPYLKTVPIDLVHGSSLIHWLSDKQTLIGELLSFDHLEKLPHSITNGDGSFCEFKYLGGLRVGIRFASCRDRNLFVKSWTEWFCWVDSGDIAAQTFDRIAWIKIYGLPYKLWNEENFAKIGESFGRVIVPYNLDQAAVDLSFVKMGILTQFKIPISSESVVSINGQVLKIGVVEMDFDWTPFKLASFTQEKEISSDEDDDDDENGFSEDEDGISDTVCVIAPEEGEIIEDDDVEMVADSAVADGIAGGGDGAEIQTSVAPAGVSAAVEPNESDINGSKEPQSSPTYIPPPADKCHVGNMEKSDGAMVNNSSPRMDLPSCDGNTHVPSLANQVDPPSFGPFENLANSGCFGPFPSNNSPGPIISPTMFDGLNFSTGNTSGKRRRILHPGNFPPFVLADPPVATQPVPPSLSPIDLNAEPIPSTVPLPDSDEDSPSSSSEFRKTAMVGQLLGFDIEMDNPILKEVMEKSGENVAPQ
ncbi:hypothetical protein L1887_23275 [Cichorium endivia]|nr:hypothetical protein L1887_23275 [Cichorium endivia]